MTPQSPLQRFRSGQRVKLIGTIDPLNDPEDFQPGKVYIVRDPVIRLPGFITLEGINGAFNQIRFTDRW